MAKQLEGFSDDYKQRFVVTIGEPEDNYASATIEILYSIPRNNWFMDVTWNGVSKKGLKVVNSKNMLRDFRNLFPFGILVTGGNGQDPMLNNSFVPENEGGSHIMLILNETEAQELSS